MSEHPNMARLRAWKEAELTVEPTPPTIYAKGCTGKVRHPTKDAAIGAKTRIKDRSLMTYLCRHCQGWHVGHPVKDDRP